MTTDIEEHQQRSIFQPLMIQVRHRKSIDVRKPLPGPLLRRMLQEISAPIEMKTITPMGEHCQKMRQQRSSLTVLNQYEEFVLKYTQEVLKNCRMLMVYQHLPMSANEKKSVKVKLAENDFHLLTVQNKIMKIAIADTRMANLNPLLVSFNYFIASEKTDIASLLKCTQTMSKMILLGGMVDNHLLTKEGILECGQISSLDHVRGELLTVLGSNMSQTRRLLGHHQSQLSTNLTQLVKQNVDKEEK